MGLLRINPFEPTLKTFVSSPSLPYLELSTGSLYLSPMDLVEHDILCTGDDEDKCGVGKIKRDCRKKKERKAAKEKY